MDKISKIENELVEAGAIKPLKKNEDRQVYLARLTLAITKLPDPDWEALTQEAKDWTNSAAEVCKANKSADLKPADDDYDQVADFPDYAEEDDNPPMDEEVDEEEEAPKPVAAKPKAKVKEKEEKEPKPKSTHPPGTRRVSACHTIKKMVAKNPTISISDLSEKLREGGLKVSDVTIATMRSDVRDTLRVLNELKMGEFAL